MKAIRILFAAIALTAILCSSTLALAAPSTSKKDPKKPVPEIADRPTLLVVHAQESFEHSLSAKAEIDRYIALFKQNENPVIYLSRTIPQFGDPADFKERWYTEDKDPTLRLVSLGGEYAALIRHPEVYVTGGYFLLFGGMPCAITAISHTIYNYFERAKGSGPLTIQLPIFALYSDPFEAGQQEEISASLKTNPKELLNFALSHDEIFTQTSLNSRGISKSERGKTHYQLNASDDGWEIDSKTRRKIHAYRITAPNTFIYTFTLRVDGKTFETMGTGSRQVILNFQTNRLYE